MALKGLLTIDELNAVEVDSDPSQSPGVTSPMSSLALLNNGNVSYGAWIKVGTAATSWLALSTVSYSCAAPIANLSASTSNAEGSASTISRSDHSHAITTGPAIAQIPDQVSAVGTSSSLARSDHVHNIGTDVPVNIGTANALGTSSSFSRSNHVHNLALANGSLVFTSGSLSVGFGLPVTQTPDQTNASGSASTAARSDHVHNIPTAAPIASLSAITTNASGTAATFIHSDHGHAIITGTAIAQIPDQANAVGTSASMSRSDHVHNIGTDVPVDISTANALGTSTSFARSNHVHRLPISSSLVFTSDSLTVSFGIPVTLNPDIVNTAGSAATISHSDHIHNVPTDIPVTITPDQTNALGTSSSFSRANHIHQIVTAAPITSLTAITTNSQGVATSFARSDHVHAIVTGIAVTQLADQANFLGSSASLSRSDHIHNIPTDTPVSIGTANAIGTSSSFARSNHIHQGVHSITVASGTARYGDITLTQGSGITISDSSGNYTFIANTVTGSGLKIKAGLVTSGSFAGNPKKATVTFSTAFASTAYAITITGIDNRNWTYESKAAGSFVINANAFAALTGEVSWSAIQTGESN